MGDTPETNKAERMAFSQEYMVPTEFARQLERERDEAREKVEQQRKEIVRLNGATNHAGGTPLKIALRERDEARGALMEIEDRCVDCEDACGDIQKIRDIAVKALKVIK